MNWLIEHLLRQERSFKLLFLPFFRPSRLPPYRGLALAMSVLMHVGIGMALGAGTGSENIGMASTHQAKALLVDLKVSENLSIHNHPKLEELNKATSRTSAPLPNQGKTEQLGVKQSFFPVIRKPHYFSIRELTEKPVVARDVPSELDLPNVQPRSVVLTLMINETGSVDRVVVEDSDLPQQTERTLVGIFSKATFHPGKLNNVPVNSQLRIQVSIENLRAQ